MTTGLQWTVSNDALNIKTKVSMLEIYVIRISLVKALWIDVDFEPHAALSLGRAGQPFAHVGRQIEIARRFGEQPEAMAAAHHCDRRLGGAEDADGLVARRVLNQH